MQFDVFMASVSSQLPIHKNDPPTCQRQLVAGTNSRNDIPRGIVKRFINAVTLVEQEKDELQVDNFAHCNLAQRLNSRWSRRLSQREAPWWHTQ